MLLRLIFAFYSQYTASSYLYKEAQGHDYITYMAFIEKESEFPISHWQS